MNKRIAFVAILALLGAGALAAALLWWPWPPGGGEMGGLSVVQRVRSGPFVVGIGLGRVPQVGENRLLVTLSTPNGQPVSGAELTAYGQMAAMGAMPAMRAPLRFREAAPGRYLGRFELQMGGAWPLTLAIAKPGVGETRLGFDLATGRAGLRLNSGGRVLADAGAEKRAMPAAQAAPTMGGPTITVNAERRQLIGLELGRVAWRELTKTVRAVGRVVYEEPALSQITLRFDAWIGKLYADFVGTRVEAGEALFTVYGPKLFAAQQEYLSAYRRARRLDQAGEALLAAARQRLALWGVSEAQIRALETRGKPLEYLPIFSPEDGVVIESQVVAGAAVRAGQPLMRIADLSQVWVQAEIYESDLALVETGMPATVTLPYLPGVSFKARIEDIYPFLEGESRTATLRLTLDNPRGALKPKMFANVRLQAALGERLTVPEEAVLVAGDTRVVFVDRGEGRLEAVKIETGQQAGGYVEVSQGVSAGERVVTSGNFLIAAETRLKTGIEQW